jgi:uncharacterized coiled-coil DUF342 family protein
MEENNQKPLTLNELAKYNQEVLFPFMQENFVTKKELDEFKDEYKADFSNLQTSVDTYAKKADTYFQEMVMLSHKVDRHEKWFLQVANKLGINLEY